MTNRFNTKWYNTWWFRVAGIVLIIIGIYFSVKKTTAYFNYTELIKLENEALFLKTFKQDSLIKISELEIEKLKLKISKINTNKESEKILFLEKELELLRKRKLVKDTLSPEELNIYLQKLFK